MASLVIEAVGWVGVLLVFFAYVLITIEKVKGSSILYQAINFFGAFFIGINAYFNRAHPSAGLQVVWMIIALYGMTKIWKKEK